MTPRLPPVIAILAGLAALAGAPAGATGHNGPYRLDQLVDAAARHVAPAPLRSAMVKLLKDELAECQTDVGFPDAVKASYFSAISLPQLPGPPAYLVYPSMFCPTFFGAHSISFWIVQPDRPGHADILLAGRQDAVEFIVTAKRRYPLVRFYYGVETKQYRFDGRRYLPSP